MLKPPVPPGGSSEPAQAGDLDFDAARISQMLGAINAIGEQAGRSIVRPALSREEQQAHELVATWLRELGFTVGSDAIGNTMADLVRAPGPRLVIGSHVDTPPGGGGFDGTAGMVAAVEVARYFASRQPGLQHPLRVACFAGEEDARFGDGRLGSRAAAGLLAPSALDALIDDSGVTASAALENLGLDPNAVGSAQWKPDECAAFFELHVEQGNELEETGVSVGLADGVTGHCRIDLTIEGRSNHAGSAPMAQRSDPVPAVAELILAAEGVAQTSSVHGPRVTVGRLLVEPCSPSTIASRVRLSIDVYDGDAESLDAVARSIIQAAGEITRRRQTTLVAGVVAHTRPAVLPTWLRQIGVQAVAELGIDYRLVMSRGLRDTQVMNEIMPAGLVLVPSRGGLSHNPDEWTSPVDIARGSRVLAEWISRLDEQLTKWRQP